MRDNGRDLSHSWNFMVHYDFEVPAGIPPPLFDTHPLYALLPHPKREEGIEFPGLVE